MSFDLDNFKLAYARWVSASLPDYLAGNVAKIVASYPFVEPDGIPWTPYTGHPSQQSFALVTSGGLYLKESQPPFETRSIHGDASFRELPKTVGQRDIGIAHAHYDHALANEDLNTIFPVHRMLEMESEGILGKVADLHYSFSYVNDVVTLVSETMPKFLSLVSARKVDVLLLAPV